MNIFICHGELIKNLISSYDLISNYTLNPKSRLFTIYDMSKRYLMQDTSFVEVGCWRGA